ncbi:MAG: AraC family transcriptional regulator [Pseudomonadota bacterium]
MATVELSVYGLISAIVAGIGAFCALLLLIAPARAPRPLELAAFVALTAFSSATVALADAGALTAGTWLLLPLTAPPFLAAPALYGYTVKLGGRTAGWRLTVAMPALLGTAAALAWWWSVSATGTLLTTTGMIVGLAFYLFSLGFAAAAGAALLSTRRNAAEYFADRTGLAWLGGVIAAYAAVLLCDFVFGYVVIASSEHLELLGALLTAGLSVVTAVTALFALRQNAVPPSAVPRYASSGLDAGRRRRLAERLETDVVAGQWHLDNDVTLDTLAAKLGVKRHHLSQILNQELASSFYTFINRLRVQHARALLESTGRTVLDIAYASGYNNKASFYKAFRDIAGMTPSVYRQRHRSAQVAAER